MARASASAAPAAVSPRPGTPQTGLRTVVVRLGADAGLFADLYHDVLTMRWSLFLFALFGVQIGINLIFGGLFYSCGNGLNNASGFLDSFYFSVQTWATIGYGGMTPKSTWANMLVVIESALATIFTALATGLTFAKFARPTVRLLFSRRATITKRDGMRVLMFRVANERGNAIVEASARVSVLTDEVSKEGDRMRRVRDLKLVRDVQPIFLMTWTVMHEIDDDSIMARVLASGEDYRITVSLTAFDGTLSQTIHATHIYTKEDIATDAKFVDVIAALPDGRMQIDLHRFHDVEPQSEPHRVTT